MVILPSLFALIAPWVAIVISSDFSNRAYENPSPYAVLSHLSRRLRSNIDATRIWIERHQRRVFARMRGVHRQQKQMVRRNVPKLGVFPKISMKDFAMLLVSRAERKAVGRVFGRFAHVHDGSVGDTHEISYAGAVILRACDALAIIGCTARQTFARLKGRATLRGKRSQDREHNQPFHLQPPKSSPGNILQAIRRTSKRSALSDEP
jgi:hypothetical protein